MHHQIDHPEDYPAEVVEDDKKFSFHMNKLSCKFPRLMLKFYIKLASLQILRLRTNHQSSNSKDSYAGWIVCKLPSFDFSSSNRLRNLAHILLPVYASYVTLKVFALWILQSNYDAQIYRISKGIKLTGSNLTCLSQQDLSLISDKLRRIDNTRSWLDFFGNPLPDVRGIGITIYILIAVAMLVYFHIGFILCRKPRRVDCWNFIIDPVGERRRMRGELSILVSQLIETSKNFQATSSRQSMRRRIDCYRIEFGCYDQHQSNIYSELRVAAAAPPIEIQQSPALRRMSHRQYVSMMKSHIDFLGSIRRNNLLEPANISWSKGRYLLLSPLTFVFGTTVTVLFAVLIIIFPAYHQLAFLVEDRINNLQCLARAGPSAIHVDSLGLRSRRAKQAEGPYLDYMANRTAENYSKLWQIEAASYFGSRISLTLLETSLLCCLTSCCLSLYGALFLHSHVNKLLWINQIESQFKECLSIINGSKIFASEESNNEQLIRKIVLAYCNWELYRRQYKCHRSLMDTCLSQVSIVTFIPMLTNYIVYLFNLTDHREFVLMVTTTMICFTNVHLVSASLITNKHLRIAKMITRIVVDCETKQALNESHIVDLMKRQLLGEEEVTASCSPKFLGFHLSYDKALTINLYLLILYIL